MEQVRYKIDKPKAPKRRKSNTGRVAVRRGTVPLEIQIKNTSSSRNIVDEIWGQWPGKESIEQMLDMLKASEGIS